MLFRDRELIVRWSRKKDEPTGDNPGEDNFEKRADQILFRLEDLGAKMFLGVCAYILLDTFRQVRVEHARHDQK